MSQPLQTAAGNTLKITDEIRSRESPPEHTQTNYTVDKVFERLNEVPWREIADHLTQYTDLTQQQARIYVLDRFDISRQLIADLLELSPNTVDNHKQAVRQKPDTTHNRMAIYNDGAGLLRIHTVPLFIRFKEMSQEHDVFTPQHLYAATYNVLDGTTVYIDRIRNDNLTRHDTDSDTLLHSEAEHPEFQDGLEHTAQEITFSFIRYSDPVGYAYEVLGHHHYQPATDQYLTAMYEQLEQLPVFELSYDTFCEEWQEIETRDDAVKNPSATP